MERNQLRSGILLSYLNLALGMLIPFFYTPIMLRMLGQAEYGLFSLASSAVHYLSLLSFGFGSTIIRYISKYRAENDKASEERAYGFFLLLYCVMAVLVLACGTVISFNVEPIFKKGLTSAELSKMKALVMIMTFNSALSFPLSVFSSMINAHEKFVFKRCIDLISTVAAPAANLVALSLGYASVGMALAATIIQFMMLPINIVYCYRKLKIKPRFARMPKPLIKEMVGFSFFVFMGSIVDMLFWTTDKVILGMLAGTTAVAIYNVGGTFNNTVINMSTAVSGVLTPKITAMVVKDTQKDELSELFVRVGRLQYLVIALVVAGFTVFGQSFINLWAGEEYAEAYWITVLTLFPLCIPLIQNTGLSIIIAQNKHRFRSIVYLIIAAVNVVSTYLVVPYWGIIGAAACSGVSYIIGQGIIMNIYYSKVTGLNIPLFWKNILRMSIIPALMIVAGLVIDRYLIMDNWLIFFLSVIVFTIVYAVLMYLLVMNEYEKDVFRKPLKRLAVKLNMGGER